MKIRPLLLLLLIHLLFSFFAYSQDAKYKTLKNHIFRNISVSEIQESSRMTFFIELDVDNGRVKKMQFSDTTFAKYFQKSLLSNYDISEIAGFKKGKYILPLFINPHPSINPREKDHCFNSEEELSALLSNLFVLKKTRRIYLKPILVTLSYAMYE